jgi:hypothetical protein
LSSASPPAGVELILAVNATVEGQTTAHYLTDQLAHFGVKVTRLAHGVPVGGELDYLDGHVGCRDEGENRVLRKLMQLALCYSGSATTPLCPVGHLPSRGDRPPQQFPQSPTLQGGRPG